MRPLGPGPGAYLLPSTVGYEKHDGTKYRYPMYSFGMNIRTQHNIRAGPGPSYKIDRFTRYGPVSMPAWSLGARIPSRKAYQNPGPGAHAPEKCPPMSSPRPPSYSLGARLGHGDKSRGPAPNAYAIRFGPGSPSYSLGPRLGFNRKTLSPGPAAYFQRNTEVYKYKSPSFSLGARLEGLGKPSKSPGPANYPPQMFNVKKCQPLYSFGVKHSEWSPPMIIDEDIMDCL